MNNRTLTLTLVLLLPACAHHDDPKREAAIQITKVPAAVIAAFQTKHPNQPMKFHEQVKDSETSYEAHYMSGSRENSERFSATGELLESEEEIDLAAVPEMVSGPMRAFLLKEDPDSKTLKVQKVSSAEFKGYELKVQTHRSRTTLMEYFFKTDGTLDHQEELELTAIPTLY